MKHLHRRWIVVAALAFGTGCADDGGGGTGTGGAGGGGSSSDPLVGTWTTTVGTTTFTFKVNDIFDVGEDQKGGRGTITSSNRSCLLPTDFVIQKTLDAVDVAAIGAGTDSDPTTVSFVGVYDGSKMDGKLEQVSAVPACTIPKTETTLRK